MQFQVIDNQQETRGDDFQDPEALNFMSQATRICLRSAQGIDLILVKDCLVQCQDENSAANAPGYVSYRVGLRYLIEPPALSAADKLLFGALPSRIWEGEGDGICPEQARRLSLYADYLDNEANLGAASIETWAGCPNVAEEWFTAAQDQVSGSWLDLSLPNNFQARLNALSSEKSALTGSLQAPAVKKSAIRP